MLILDASSLYEALVGTQKGEAVRMWTAADASLAAPHVIDVEVLSIIRKEWLLGRLDRTAATQSVEDLRDWPAQRFGHGPLLARAWELRHNVRGWDAMYVALAEELGGTLLTLDGRLARVDGLLCRVEVL
ncbi:MAG TPA: type II toxin-antitoxin system VapC family toxin [Chloroflexota bacterium]|jgi:predicted nucleic acid-binding protein|nr:type II toxin-antitoxin system VapC family toxin [Chloroflexota bacterium]